MPAEHPLTPRSCRVSLGISLISRPLREKSLNLLAMPPHQPLRVQHAGTILLLVPRRPEPPAHFPARLQPKLQQPQQAHRHPLRLTGPLDRVGRPRPALLPAQPLLQVAEPVLLPEPRVNNSTICSPVNSTAEVTRVNRSLDPSTEATITLTGTSQPRTRHRQMISFQRIVRCRP